MSRPTGRPPMYRAELAQQVLDRLANGESLRAICGGGDMPSRPTVYEWVDRDIEGFADRYARARDMGLDVVADDVMRIVDEPVGSTDNGGTDSGAVADKRLRFDARRWYLSKLAPKRYGDKLTQEISGPDGGPVVISDPDKRAARAAALLKLAEARKALEDDSIV